MKKIKVVYNLITIWKIWISNLNCILENLSGVITLEKGENDNGLNCYHHHYKLFQKEFFQNVIEITS